MPGNGMQESFGLNKREEFQVRIADPDEFHGFVSWLDGLFFFRVRANRRDNCMARRDHGTNA